MPLKRRPFKLRELLKRLQSYGITTMTKRGKGSEIILLKPNAPKSRQGPQYPIKNHGLGTEIKIPVINAILRHFNIDPKEFWS